MSNIVFFVGYFISPQDVANEIRAHFSDRNVSIGMIYDQSTYTNSASIKRKIDAAKEVADIAVGCDMSSVNEIAKELEPYKNAIIAVTSRGESFLPELSRVSEVLSESVRMPSPQAIENTSDKNSMRSALAEYDQSIIPGFLKIEDDSERSVQKVLNELSLPVILKPSGLSTSMLVTKCETEDELRSALKHIFSVIGQRYEKYKGRGRPVVLAEEFMVGGLYSVDAYVDETGKALFCPAVEVKTAVEVGKQDYYGFSQIAPSALSSDEEAAMQKVAQKSVYATGLTNSSAHIELIRTDNGWKIVELGPRTGGQRTTMYALSHGIKHSLNDILVRTAGESPDIPTESKMHVAYVKLYGDSEGVIESVSGVDSISQLESYHKHTVTIKPGEMFLFARNGGLAVVDLILAHSSREQLQKDIEQADRLFSVQVQR